MADTAHRESLVSADNEDDNDGDNDDDNPGDRADAECSENSIQSARRPPGAKKITEILKGYNTKK